MNPKKQHDIIAKIITALNEPKFSNTLINNPGFGSILSLLDDQNHYESTVNFLKKYYDEEQTLEIIKSLKTASLTSYFTPVDITSSIVDSIKKYSFSNILEPSAGYGAFVQEFKSKMPNSKITAFEKDILTAKILDHNFKNDTNISTYGVPFENIDSTDSDKFYDLIVSNIPFGQTKIFDPSLVKSPIKNIIQNTIHGYFIYKSLDLLKSNGLGVFIVTKNFMDKRKYEDIRKQLIIKNDFLGGIRFPNHLFKSENTRIVSDLLIFKKRDSQIIKSKQKALNKIFTESIELEVEDNTVQLNNYFRINENKVLGKMIPGGLFDNKDYTVISSDSIKKISVECKSFLDTILKEYINKKSNKSLDVSNLFTQEKTIKSSQSIEFSKPIEPKTKFNKVNIGHLIIKNDKIFKVKAKNEFTHIKTNTIEYDKLTKIISLKVLCEKLKKADNLDDYNQIQTELNVQYDYFNFQYGFLTDKSNRYLVSKDSQAALIFSLEKISESNTIKSDIFSDSFKDKTYKHKTTKVSLDNAILISLNTKGNIDIEYISELTNTSKEDILKKGLTEKLFFINPLDDELKIVVQEEFLSGHIKNKILFYKSGKFKHYDKYIDKIYLNDIIRDLEEILPAKTPFEHLGIKLAEPWFDIKITQNFIKNTYNTSVIIKYNDSLNKYYLSYLNKDYSLTKEFNVKTENRNYTFSDVLINALNENIPYVTKGDKDNKKIDRKSMEELRLKNEQLYSDFNKYILKNKSIKEEIENLFYEKFDAIVKSTFKGTYLNYQGLKNFKPYNYQNFTVSNIIKNNGLLVNKQVGYGKTLTMILTASKLYEIYNKRTLIIGLNSTIVQLEKEFLTAFPEINLLTGNDKNTKGKKKRNEFFKQILEGNHQVILMSHDLFKFIPQSLSIQKKILKNELENLEKDLASTNNNTLYGINKRSLKGLEIRKENLQAELNSIYHKINTVQDNKTLDFEAMNIDHIMVDESHYFKNLMYTTRHNRVAGLNTSKGSDKSKNLLTAIRTLQEKFNGDYQASFFSGTPISNSILECYVIFKYLIPKELERLNISSFDQWAKTFAVKTFEFEPTLNGSYKVKERFRKFKKLKQLSKLYNQISVLVNQDTHPKDLPEIKPEIIQIEQTPQQQKYSDSIQEFLRTGNLNYIHTEKKYKDEKSLPIALISLHHMRYNAIDPRLILPYASDEPNNKIRTCAENIYQTYLNTNHFKGTQAIFSDIGTPKSSFNVYDELKSVLVDDYGIPKNEIAFIHDFNSDDKKKNFMKMFNNGTIRIVIGSTTKLGTGTNIQEKLIKIHHLDLPHKSTDIDQRIGRGKREGNIAAKKYNNNILDVVFYLTKGTSDAVFLNNINIKNNFIKQLNKGTIKYNELDMGPIDDNGNIDYKSMIAISHNNPLFLKKKELTQKFEKLKIEYDIHKSNIIKAKNSLQLIDCNLNTNRRILNTLSKDYDSYYSSIESDNYYDLVKVNTQFFKKNTNSPKKLGEAIQTIINENFYSKKDIIIANFIDTKLIMKVNTNFPELYTLIVETPNHKYSFGSKQLTVNPISMADYIKNSLNKTKSLIKNYEESIYDYEKDLEANKLILNRTFDKEQEIEELQKEINSIDSKLEKDCQFEPPLKNSEIIKQKSNTINY